MDWTEILTAIIAAAAAVGGSAVVQSKATAILQEQVKSLKEDVAALSNRVDKHNKLQERMMKAECKIEELERMDRK